MKEITSKDINNFLQLLDKVWFKHHGKWIIEVVIIYVNNLPQILFWTPEENIILVWPRNIGKDTLIAEQFSVIL